MHALSPEQAVERLLALKPSLEAVNGDPEDWRRFMGDLATGEVTVFTADEDATTLAVRTLIGGDLVVELAHSCISGCIRRNIRSLIAIATRIGCHRLVCRPASKSRQRLYRRFGFRPGFDGRMFMLIRSSECSEKP